MRVRPVVPLVNVGGVERFRELELPVPDTGSVREDLCLIVRNGIAVLTTTVWGRALPALVAEQMPDWTCEVLPDLAGLPRVARIEPAQPEPAR